MSKRTKLLLLLIAFSIAVYLGMLDYETESFWQLFNRENSLTMVLFTLFWYQLLRWMTVAIRAFWPRKQHGT